MCAYEANVADVTGIEDEHDRLMAERINIYAGKDYILNAAEYRCGRDFVDAVRRAERKAAESLR